MKIGFLSDIRAKYKVTYEVIERMRVATVIVAESWRKTIYEGASKLDEDGFHCLSQHKKSEVVEAEMEALFVCLLERSLLAESDRQALIEKEMREEIESREMWTKILLGTRG